MIHLTSVDPANETCDTLVVPVCEDIDIHSNSILKELIQSAKKMPEFKGEPGDEIIFYAVPKIKATRVVLGGLGKSDALTAEKLRCFSGKVVKQCITKKMSGITIVVPDIDSESLMAEAIFKALMEGACLANHIYDKYKKEKKLKPIETIRFLIDTEKAKKYRLLPKQVQTLCGGTILAREWVSTPSNDKKPEQLIKSIAAEAKKYNVPITILNEKELKQKKFGAILAVAAGSESRPGLVMMEHSPQNAKKTVLLVGKGVTFDAGGINLKGAAGLETMKMDMAGAAAVAATVITAARLNLKQTRIVGVLPIVENMPSGRATRPGDVITSFGGKTIEVGNTDAEGRLILADAISYALKIYSPDTVIDIATLTGACIVALGEKIAGVFSTDNALATRIVSAGERTYERCWQMPLPEDYKELMKSDLADIKNLSSSKGGGAITAALFLADFIDKDIPWAHIDIAGPAYIGKATDYCGSGGTGFGVRLICDYLENI